MTLYIYKLKDNGSTWDNFGDDDMIIVASITKDTNSECEEIALERWGDTDLYGWTYTITGAEKRSDTHSTK